MIPIQRNGITKYENKVEETNLETKDKNKLRYVIIVYHQAEYKS